jgi:dienelactone hydrolase
MSWTFVEHDELTPPERRAQIEAWLGATGEPYQVNLYGGTSHGFATRANVSDPRQKYAKETAFYQAVRWFDAWAAGDL